jgi:hypothetical protein
MHCGVTRAVPRCIPRITNFTCLTCALLCHRGGFLRFGTKATQRQARAVKRNCHSILTVVACNRTQVATTNECRVLRDTRSQGLALDPQHAAAAKAAGKHKVPTALAASPDTREIWRGMVDLARWLSTRMHPYVRWLYVLVQGFSHETGGLNETQLHGVANLVFINAHEPVSAAPQNVLQISAMEGSTRPGRQCRC